MESVDILYFKMQLRQKRKAKYIIFQINPAFPVFSNS